MPCTSRLMAIVEVPRYVYYYTATASQTQPHRLPHRPAKPMFKYVRSPSHPISEISTQPNHLPPSQVRKAQVPALTTRNLRTALLAHPHPCRRSKKGKNNRTTPGQENQQQTPTNNNIPHLQPENRAAGTRSRNAEAKTRQ